MIRVVELFAGIGSQRMALVQAGIPHEVVAISEIDRHALASYEAIWGDCPNLGDITQVERLPPCDLVTYSFPCQDLSVAGKRRGMGEGTRSGLVWEVLRLLESAGERERPEWLLMENVPQVLAAPQWPELVGRLEAMGYRNRWAKLDSSAFGSAQKRVRAFMVSRLGAEPPDLPTCAPNAPRLCLRDIMEGTRDEKYVRRIPLDRIRWREPKEGYRHPQSDGLSCSLIDGADSLMDSRRIMSDMGLCYTVKGSHIKTVAPEEEARVAPLVERAENLRMAPKGRKAVGTIADGGMRLQVAPSDAGSSTPIAEIEGETFYSKRVLYSSSSSSPTVRTDHGANCGIKVIGEDMSEKQWKPHRYILDADGPCRVVGAYTNAAQRGIKVVADIDQRHECSARIYSDEGCGPTVTDYGKRGGAQPKIVQFGAEKEGVVDQNVRHREVFPDHRYYEERGLSPCITVKDPDIKVVAEDTASSYRSRSQILSSSSSSPALRANAHGPMNQAKVAAVVDEELVVSLLTPSECWRLMGQPYWAYKRASAVCSPTQLYNQAGNSIVVEVLMAIFSAMFGTRPPGREQSRLERFA